MEVWEEDLKQHLEMFNGKKKVWQPEELQIAYRIWNGAHGEKFGYRTDTGCSDCRRSIVQGVNKLAIKFSQDNIPPTKQ